MRQDYSLFKRENGVWYFWFYDNDGKRKKLSTGETAKGRAREYASKYCAKLTDKASVPFGELFSDWFVKETCPYYQENQRNGKILSDAYLRSYRSVLKKYILPYWGKYLLSEIRPMMIEDWKFHLLEDEELNPKSVRTYMACFSIMMEWAWRREIIDENPCKRVKRPSPGNKERGVLAKEEVKKLFSEHWKNEIAYYANYLAMLTGMRVGEVIGLRHQDILPDEQLIKIEHSYDSNSGTLGQTKTRKIRYVPVPRTLAEVICSFNSGGKEAYVFSKTGEKPILQQTCLYSLRAELENIGISREEQQKRGICFHSWRHFLNSQLRVSGVPDLITREITGHATEAMMEHYTHLSAADMKVVGKVQLELVSNN